MTDKERYALHKTVLQHIIMRFFAGFKESRIHEIMVDRKIANQLLGDRIAHGNEW